MIETVGGTLQTQAKYVYDVFGDRIETEEYTATGGAVTTEYAYNGVNVWAQLSGSGTLEMRQFFLDGQDQVMARVSAGGTAAWYDTDHMGSVRDVVNYAGTIVLDQVAYDAYGNVMSETNAALGDAYKFDGYIWDVAIGLYYARARCYAPSTGEWIQQDPSGFRAGDTDLSRYVRDDPTNITDPDGLADEKLTPDTDVPYPFGRMRPRKIYVQAGARVNGAGTVLTVFVGEGSDWVDQTPYTFAETMAGTDASGADSDSAQFAIRFTSPSNSAFLPKKYTNAYESRNGRPRGAYWEPGNATQTQVRLDVGIPPGATHLELVIIYTDVLKGPDRDMPIIMASYTGEKNGGAWIVTKNPGDVTDTSDTQQPNSHGQIGAYVGEVMSVLWEKTRSQLVRRSPSGRLRLDPGYDIKQKNPAGPEPPSARFFP